MLSINLFKKHIFLEFMKNILKVGTTFIAFAIVLDLFEEISFFKEYDVIPFFPLIMSLLKVPSILYEIFPFIFLISSILLFLYLLQSEELNLIKLAGLSNFRIIMYPAFISLICGIIIISGFTIISSKLSRLYLNIKNDYTLENDYLAAITENGIWIKDIVESKNIIINASSLEENFLVNVSIFEFEEDFNFLSRMEIERVDISSKYWKLYNLTKYYQSNNKTENFDELVIKSNFDLNKLKNIFSELRSLSFWELNKAKRNYEDLGISTLEIESEFHKALAYPLFLMCMTIIAGLFVLGIESRKSYLFYVFLAIVLSVIIYYLNYFSKALGDTNKLDIIAAIWSPIIILTIFCSIGLIRINEK